MRENIGVRLGLRRFPNLSVVQPKERRV